MDYTSILGIDVASNKLDICYFSDKQDCEYFQIDYTDQSMDHFLMEHPEIAPGHCLVGVESTGDYHLKVVKYLLKKKFSVKVLNPILTKQYTRTTIRGAKTDKKDSELIAKLVKEGHGDLANLKSITNREKELLRLSRTLTKQASSLKLTLQSLKRKALDDSQMIQSRLNDIIEDLGDFSKSLTQEATQNPSEQEKLIDTIPGFATKLSAVVHHELGDIHRFNNIKSIWAYAGLDPRVKQSGKNLNTQGHLTKRGSPNLRSALFLAANVARRYDTELTTYYDKKRKEGRSHKETLCIISRKLLARVYAVLKEQRSYIKK